jgi:predicted Zn-dependent protease
MPHTFDPATRHIKAALLATLSVVSLGLPALAVDTGGGGGVPAAAPAPAPSAMTPRAAPHTTPQAPRARLLDLDDARALIARNDWDGALKMLKVIVVQQPRNADALNLYGRSLREKGRLREAESWYLKALKLRPSHRGANEYLGELYVMTGQMKKAEARLDTLAKLCGNTTCEEYRDLAKAIAAKA